MSDNRQLLLQGEEGEGINPLKPSGGVGLLGPLSPKVSSTGCNAENIYKGLREFLAGNPLGRAAFHGSKNPNLGDLPS